MIRLSPNSLADVRDFLREDIPTNIYLLSMLERAEHTASDSLVLDGEMFGAPSSRRLQGVAYASRTGLIVLYAINLEVAFAMGDYFRDRIIVRMVVGPQEETDAFWQGLKSRHEPRLHRIHRLYTLEPHQLAVPSEDAITIASLDDLESCCTLGAKMQHEELGVDPMTINPSRFRKRMEELIDRQALHILRHKGEIAFQASTYSTCVDGVQVEGVFTPPAIRRRGFALRGMAAMCVSLFERFPRITLHVNEENEGALRLYDRLGFVHYTTFRLIGF
jgi:hypothetical protein